jgi:hypothetical protein
MMDGRTEPDQLATAYLKAVAGDQEAVARATPPRIAPKKSINLTGSKARLLS